LERERRLPIELVPPRRKRLSPWAVIVALVLVAAFVLSPILRSALGAGVGVALGIVYVLAYLFAVVMLPLMLFALMKFAYSVFMRPYLRAWHINHIRNARHLKEAVQRSRREE
jgi:membrane protein implicated in regulation of membrane protease activity